MSPARMEKIEAAMRVVLEFNEAFNRHDVAGMMKLMTEDCVFENTDPAPDGTAYRGKESPRAHIDIEEIFGMGYRCIMRWKYSWGDGHVRGVDVFKVTDGLISEKFSYVKG
jgi:SnoaL-like protein